MKIIALEAENLKRLTAVRIEPDGNLVQITGKNGQGKTSVLDAIWWALDGTSHVQAKPVRQGEEQAIVRLDLGDLIVTRKFRAKEDGTYTTSIIVENGEGARYSSPQKMLDNLLGNLTFDPLAFTRMKDQEQVMALRSLVPDFDFAQNEIRIREKFESRTFINREWREAKSAADRAAAELPETIPDAIDEQARQKLADAYETAMQESAELEAKYATKNQLSDRLKKIEQQRAELMSEWTDVNAQLEQIGEIPDLETSMDKIAEARSELFAVDAKNKIAEAAALASRLSKEAEDLKQKSESLTEEIDDLKDKAKSAIAGADLPISGLSIDGETGGPSLNGVPFNQASDAQQLEASIGIAMAMNPTLKIIRVRDGSLLDDDAMKTLASMADQNDYQIWIERVDSSGKVGFVLEDGHLKSDNPAPATSLFGGQENND